MIDSELNKARKAWSEELLMERESSIQKQNVRISELEHEAKALKEMAQKLAHQNALFKEQYPFTAYASEITTLKTIIDKQNTRYEGVKGLQQFRIDTNNKLRQQLENAEDYIDELYRLNPNLKLPNGRKFESDIEA